MNASGDAAEQTFRMVIDGTEFVLKISGSLIKETLAMLYAISKDNKQNSIGKTNLANMLKTCKDIKIFSIQRKDLEKFVKEAKNYGIYYCTLIDRKNPSEDSIVDIMVRANDAPRVDRIVERFNLSITDTASLRTESVKENGKEVVTNDTQEEVKDESIPVVDDKMMADIMGKSQISEDEVKDGVSETFLSKDEAPLEHSSENKNEEIIKRSEKKSVREQLKKFANQIKDEERKKSKAQKKEKSSKKNKKLKKESKKNGREK